MGTNKLKLNLNKMVSGRSEWDLSCSGWDCTALEEINLQFRSVPGPRPSAE